MKLPLCTDVRGSPEYTAWKRWSEEQKKRIYYATFCAIEGEDKSICLDFFYSHILNTRKIPNNL